MSEVVETIARAVYTGTHRHCFKGADPHPDDKAWESFKGEAAIVITALEAQGYAIVPIEPTEAMWDAAMREGYDQDPATYYRAMFSTGKANME